MRDTNGHEDWKAAMEKAEELLEQGKREMAKAGELDLILERETADGGDLTLDLKEVKFLDSTALGVFARAARALEGRGRLFLLSPSREVRLALEMVRFDVRSNIEIVS